MRRICFNKKGFNTKEGFLWKKCGGLRFYSHLSYFLRPVPGVSTPEQLVEYGVDPASIVPFHHDYSFTVNGGSVDIPVVSSGK